MKFLIAFASLALFAGINASPYGNSNRGGYGGGYGGPRVAYVQEVSYGNQGGYGGSSYGNQGGYGGNQASYAPKQSGYGGNQGGYGGNQGGYGGNSYAQPLRAESSEARAAAAAAANSGSIRPGNYKQAAVIGYEIDGGYNAPSQPHGYKSY